MSITLSVFDSAEFLDDEETIAHYLADAAADENPDAFLEALGVSFTTHAEPLSGQAAVHA